ncbi:gliding motility protein GldL [Chryseobacterium taklimakanense]|uniref:Gliding motility-associated protein GldL n=1 Tax=Chryseobacterium taklimakanense TaxID=536441 RepID=A0A239XUD3_9FLAO|nr:gliding motility protein GldL [Chryseobacterium taklimakanense]AZI22283.1 gliding motility protein GldL [Chryseobacterium taklimakanense]MCG7280108.1 gliding motility protein GldL [Chryseobacterium taklimakanense]SNV50531.1 gliding motility-associated protein GldL [Chryseobacterium taklimakanense]
MFKNRAAISNFVYSFFAAIVILGALFKMLHISIGPISGNLILGIGLGAEVLVFLYMAFFPDHDSTTQYAWENVYPELLDNEAQPKARTVSKLAESSDLDVSLSDKLDKMLADAKLDVNLFERLKSGIDKFSDSVEQINQTVDVSSSTRKYNDQLTLAASHLESMNALYALQLEHGKQQSEYHTRYVADLQKSAEHSAKFNEELTGLTSNLNNLNRVYGGMLNAMKS